MIEVQNLKKIYRVRTKKIFGKNKLVSAINGIDIKCRKGEIIGILGINGAGKTTILRMLSTLLLPTSGSITINNINAVKYPNEIRKIINLITGGERNLYWRLTPIENLRYFGALYKVPRIELEKRIIKLLEFTGLYNNRNMPVERFSKGMKQRLQICRGLINNPLYLFLDEPTLGLDIEISKELRKYISLLAKEEKKSIVLSTHYMLEAEELCDYIYVLHKGKIIISGSIKEIREIFPEQKRILIKTGELPDSLKKTILNEAVKSSSISLIDNNTICIQSPTENQINVILKKLLKFNIKIFNISDVAPSLEEAILNFMNTLRDNERNN